MTELEESKGLNESLMGWMDMGKMGTGVAEMYVLLTRDESDIKTVGATLSGIVGSYNSQANSWVSINPNAGE